MNVCLRHPPEAAAYFQNLTSKWLHESRRRDNHSDNILWFIFSLNGARDKQFLCVLNIIWWFMEFSQMAWLIANMLGVQWYHTNFNGLYLQTIILQYTSAVEQRTAALLSFYASFPSDVDPWCFYVVVCFLGQTVCLGRRSALCKLLLDCADCLSWRCQMVHFGSISWMNTDVAKLVSARSRSVAKVKAGGGFVSDETRVPELSGFWKCSHTLLCLISHSVSF